MNLTEYVYLLPENAIRLGCVVAFFGNSRTALCYRFQQGTKKKHRILYRVFSIHFHSDSDSKRFDPCHFPIYTRPPNLFLCADVYIHHTPCVYICTPENSLLLVAVRRWVSVLYVCTLNVPSNVHFYIGFDSFLCLVAIDCKSEIRCTVHTHISYTIHARHPFSLSRLFAVLPIRNRMVKKEIQLGIWNDERSNLSKNTPTLSHTNKHAFLFYRDKAISIAHRNWSKSM